MSPKDRTSFGSTPLTISDYVKINGWVVAIVAVTYAVLHALFPQRLEDVQTKSIAQANDAAAEAQSAVHKVATDLEVLQKQVTELRCANLALQVWMRTPGTPQQRSNTASFALHQANCPKDQDLDPTPTLGRLR